MSSSEDRQCAIDAAVMRTITSEDWARALRRERGGLRNVAREQIRAKILDLKLGKSEPEPTGEKE